MGQTLARAARFGSILTTESSGPQAAQLTNFAVSQVGLSGGYLSQGTYLLNTAVGTPPVTVPLVVDTGSPTCFTQGPDCTTCPSSNTACQNSPFTTSSNCPYTGTIYDPAKSSTADSSASCDQCAAGSFNTTGCFGYAFSPPNTCQFDIQFGSGNAAGQYRRDVVSVGAVSTGSQKIFIGTTNFESQFDGTAGLLGFGPTGTSLPFQLKQVGSWWQSIPGVRLLGGSAVGNVFHCLQLEDRASSQEKDSLSRTVKQPSKRMSNAILPISCP